MERILGGILVALVLALGVSSTAHAASIPPTAACEDTFTKGFNEYLKDTDGDSAQDEDNVALKKLANDLEAAGCITSAEPLVGKTEAKPFTDQCISAAAKAKKFFDPKTAEIKASIKYFKKVVERPLFKALRHVNARAERFDSQDRPRKAARLVRKSNKLYRFIRDNQRDFRDGLVAKDAYRNLLVIYELGSLRCFGPVVKFNRATGPVEKVLARNRNLIYRSIYFIIREEFGPVVHSSQSSESSLRALPAS